MTVCSDTLMGMNSNAIYPIALRKAKIVYNFGFSECNRVKMWDSAFLFALQCKKLFIWLILKIYG